MAMTKQFRHPYQTRNWSRYRIFGHRDFIFYDLFYSEIQGKSNDIKSRSLLLQ